MVNKTQQESYETIQAAVDDANEGDTIIVCEDQQLNDGVVIEVPGLTIKGFDKPTVDGNGNFSVFEILADGVTIADLGITNPEGDTGIESGDGLFTVPDINDVTIRDNHLFEIGQGGGIAGIDVSDGNFTNLNIIGNTIEDITSDGNSWGMIFDGEGTITDSTIK